MNALSFAKQATLSIAFIVTMAAPAVAQLLPVVASGVITVGACQAYESDGQDDPQRGGAILLKCPKGYIAGEESDGMKWKAYSAGMDTVSYNMNVSPPESALKEYAVGLPPGFTPEITSTSGVVIISYKVYACPYKVPKVWQLGKNVILDGGLAYGFGGDICGSPKK